MPDEYALSHVERLIVGCRGIVLRRDHRHAETSVRAIQRRSHPAWSQFNDEVRVQEAA